MSTSESNVDSSNYDILQVTIHCCDNLKSNILLLQPVLCMHVIDAKTGTYVKKSDRNRAVVSFYENQRNDVDYIMPVMTQPCSVSGEILTSVSWEETFILNEQFNMFVHKESSIILFFEIVDLTPVSHTKHHYERLNQNGMRKIAWAFLKLVGCNGVINTGSKLRLQLYKPSKPIKKNKSYIEVYKWWYKNAKIPMKASLLITIKPHAIFTAEPVLRSMLPLQQEKGSTTFEKLSLSNKESSLHFTEQSKSTPTHAQEMEVIWSRKDGEACKVPKKKKILLDVINCCQILKFSTDGRILAVSCGTHDCYYLMFYEIPSGKLIFKIFAHSELIYDIDWSYNNKYLLSSSGDYSVKMWNVRHWNLKEAFVHPSYVYNAKFHPNSENLFASSCYDHIIRIWTFEKCQLLKELEGHNSTVCTLCWNTSGTKLYSADGIGQIKVWRKFHQVLDYQLENEINSEETKGISINKMVLDLQEKTLCLFCSDSSARILCLENGHVLSTYESDPSAPNLSKGCCSPCGNFLFLCCEKGNVSVWNKNSSIKNDPELLYNLNYGAISCIEYHPYEHMLALGFWDEGIPIHVFVHDKTGQEKEKVTNVADSKMIQDTSQKNKMCGAYEKNVSENNAKINQTVKSEKQLTTGTQIDVIIPTARKRHGPAKYQAHKLEETFLSDSLDMYPSKLQERNTKGSSTAVITKSGQFDVIAVPDDSTCSDSNTFRSLSNDPKVLNRSSKRSQRRKKLRDMHKALL